MVQRIDVLAHLSWRIRLTTSPCRGRFFSLIQISYISIDMAEREGCAQSLSSFRLPSVAEPDSRQRRERVLIPLSDYLYYIVYGGERGIRTLDPGISGIHDFQSCPFGLSGISPILYAIGIAPSVLL